MVAESLQHYTKAVGPERAIISFAFANNAASNPTSTRGKRVSVVHTATGVFTLTFADRKIIKADVIAMLGTQQITGSGTGATIEFGAWTDPTSTSGATLVVRTMVGATPTDHAANANNWVSLLFVLRTRGQDV